MMRVLDVTEMSRIHWTACWKMLVSKELLVKMVCAVVVSYLFSCILSYLTGIYSLM